MYVCVITNTENESIEYIESQILVLFNFFRNTKQKKGGGG